MLEQEPQLDESKDVRGNVEDGVAETKALLDRFNELAANYSEETAEEFGAHPGADRRGRRLEPRHAARIRDGRAAPAARPTPTSSTLSGGERRRVALCRLLLRAPDLLLLDEPTNHLDAESVAWLEQHLAEYKGTVVAVTHDRYFLDNVAGWILELDRGRGIPYEGNYSSWLEQKQARLAQEERTEKARQRTIAAELEWVRTNPKGRRTKSKARLARYEELVAEERNVKLDEVQIHIPAGPAPGRDGADGDRSRQGLRRPPADRDAVVRSAARGDRRRDRRQRRRQDDAVPDDHRRGDARRRHARARRDGAARLRRPVARRARPRTRPCGRRSPRASTQLKVGDREVNSRQYTAGFNFKGSDQQARIGNLSGGERNRVHLAKLLRSGGNLLLLDEPTNDLDVDTLRALENALLAFPGCAVVISHDRWFLDRVATHVLAFEGDSQVTLVRGQLRGLRGAPPRAPRRRRRPAAPHHLQAPRSWLSRSRRGGG